jgi:hypothetical protein
MGEVLEIGVMLANKGFAERGGGHVARRKIGVLEKRKTIPEMEGTGRDVGEESGVVGLSLLPGSYRGREGGIAGAGEVLQRGWWSVEKLGIDFGKLLERGCQRTTISPSLKA